MTHKFYNVDPGSDNPDFNFSMPIVIRTEKQLLYLPEALLANTIVVTTDSGVELSLGDGISIITHNRFLERMAAKLNGDFKDSVASAIVIAATTELLPVRAKLSGVCVEPTTKALECDPQWTEGLTNTLLGDIHSKLDAALDDTCRQTAISEIDDLEFDITAQSVGNRIVDEAHEIAESGLVYLRHGDFYDNELQVTCDGELLVPHVDYVPEFIRLHKLYLTKDPATTPFGRLNFQTHIGRNVLLTYHATGELQNKRGSISGLLVETVDMLSQAMLTENNLKDARVFTNLEQRVTVLEKDEGVAPSFRYKFGVPNSDEHWYTFAKFGVVTNTTIITVGQYHLSIDMLGSTYSVVIAIDLDKYQPMDVITVASTPEEIPGSGHVYIPKIRMIYMDPKVHAFEGALIQISFKSDEPDVTSFMPKITNLSPDRSGFRLSRPLKHGTIPPVKEPINIHCKDWLGCEEYCLCYSHIVYHSHGEVFWMGEKALSETLGALDGLEPLLHTDTVELCDVKSVDLYLTNMIGETTIVSAAHNGSNLCVSGKPPIDIVTDSVIEFSIFKHAEADARDFSMSITTLSERADLISGISLTKVMLKF